MSLLNGVFKRGVSPSSIKYFPPLLLGEGDYRGEMQKVEVSLII